MTDITGTWSSLSRQWMDGTPQHVVDIFMKIGAAMKESKRTNRKKSSNNIKSQHTHTHTHSQQKIEIAWQSLIYIRWAFSEYERNWCTMINVKIINCMCTLNVYRGAKRETEPTSERKSVIGCFNSVLRLILLFFFRFSLYTSRVVYLLLIFAVCVFFRSPLAESISEETSPGISLQYFPIPSRSIVREIRYGCVLYFRSADLSRSPSFETMSVEWKSINTKRIVCRFRYSLDRYYTQPTWKKKRLFFFVSIFRHMHISVCYDRAVWRLLLDPGKLKIDRRPKLTNDTANFMIILFYSSTLDYVALYFFFFLLFIVCMF